MSLDVRTIVVLLALSSVLMTATLAAGIRTGLAHGFGKWNLGLGLYALAWLLMASRGMLPPALTMAVADGLLLAGLCLQLAAVIEFGGGAAPRWLLYLPGPALAVALLPLMENYPVFTLTASVPYSAALIAIAAATLRLGRRGGPTRWMLAGAYAAGGVILVARALMIAIDPGAHADLFLPNLVHALSFTAMFAITAIGSIAFLLMLRDLAEAEIRRLVMFDPLTELFNRRAFMDLAGRELARSLRTRAPFAVLMMDLDQFKRVNDDFGHQAGDRVLAAFAEVAKRSVRKEDLVGRYGGEEFCAILPGAGPAKALEIAERIRHAVAGRPLAGLPRVTTVSIGVSVCEHGEPAPITLEGSIARADEALYAAKKAGRNRVAEAGNRADFLGSRAAA